MALAFAQVLGLPVSDFPMPKFYPPAFPGARADGRPPVVAILGHSRAEKGFHLIPELVERNRQLKFVIQISPEGADMMWKEARPAVHAAPNVELVHGALEPESYYALMTRCDIVLLPYDPMLVPLRSSGVFAEAVGAGRATVVPAGTWMAGHLEAGRAAGVVFGEFNPGAISVALRDAAARLPELSPRARECAPAWRAQQSTSAYLNRVMDRFGLTAAPK
jgi:glycosyltransferase involved in cell wall biosynthesis